jgi:sugar lactone lactonase YvrE
MITRNTILFLTCIMFTALAGLLQATADVEAEWIVVEKLADGAGMGPEDIAFDAEGRMYASMEGGVMRFKLDGSQPEVFAQTPGRPLGLRFDADGNLIVCDGQLFSVAPDGTVKMLSDEAEGGPITKANGLDIAQDGTIYFADTTNLSWQEEIADQGPQRPLAGL